MSRLSIACVLLTVFCLAWISLSEAAEQTRRYSTAGGDVLVEHDTSDEGLYFDVPADEVAYNVHILRKGALDYATVYHGEPKKSPGKPGDSIKVAARAGPFQFAMPHSRRFAVHGDPDDRLSALYSPSDAWGGAGNPMVVKGSLSDPLYYIFFLALTDDDADEQGSDFRHALCQMRTRDFSRFELLTDADGCIGWKQFAPDVPVAWRRPWLLRDRDGKHICSRKATDFHATQGLIGSICFHDDRYFFFYADKDTDDKTYLFFRTAEDLVNLQNDRTKWSPAKRISGPLITGAVIRVAKSRDGSRWAVLYNGYHHGPAGLRQDLFLQYTGDLSVTGANGLAGIRWYESFVGDHGISENFLGLDSGGGSFAQHCFLTDSHGALTVTDEDDRHAEVGGLLTWADFSRGVYGGRVYWAKWITRPGKPAE